MLVLIQNMSWDLWFSTQAAIVRLPIGIAVVGLYGLGVEVEVFDWVVVVVVIVRTAGDTFVCFKVADQK